MDDKNADENKDSKGSASCPENGVMTVEPMSTTSAADHDWKIWLRRTVYITYFTFMLLIIPVLIWELVTKGATFATVIWFLAGMATVFSVPISLWGILNHLIHFTQPDLQRKILRILFMVPIYGIFSWLALSFPADGVYLDAVREIYQAYVVYNFITYLITFLTNEYDMDTRMKEKPRVKSPPPCCCFKVGKNELVINRAKYGTLNYTVSRPILTIIAVICEITGNYDDGSLSIGLAWIWITLLLAISQLWAIYCLVLLYRSTREELQPLHKPYAQFLCVKMTIFGGANFQGLIIAVLVETGALKPNPDWGMDNSQFAALIQDFVVCFEMVIASLAHAYSFSYKPYKEMGNRLPFGKSLKMMFTVDDVANDVSFHVKRVGRKIKRKFTKQPKDDNKLVTNEEIPDGATATGDNTDDNSDGECDLGTVLQINDVKYSVNGTVKMYPKAPPSNNMAPRGEPGMPHNDGIVDILGQAEAALEENAMKDAGKNTKSGSFASSFDGMDLGMGMTGVPAPLSSPTRRMSKKGVMIDYELDSGEGDTLTFDLTVEDGNQNRWLTILKLK